MTDYLARETRILSGDFDSDVALLKQIFHRDATFRTREFCAGTGHRCALLYLDGMVNNQLMNLSIVRPLMLAESLTGDPASDAAQRILFSNDVKETAQLQELLRGILYGDSVLLIESSSRVKRTEYVLVTIPELIRFVSGA